MIDNEYDRILLEIRKYNPNFVPKPKTGLPYLKNMLKWYKSKNKKIVKPDPISKDYTDDWEAFEDIDDEEHISYDIEERM